MGFIKSFKLTKEQEKKISSILKEYDDKYKAFKDIVCECPLSDELLEQFEKELKETEDID